MSKKKISKYLDLLMLIKSHCKGKHCEDKFKKIISFLDEDSLKFLSECIRNTLAPERIKLFPKAKQRKIIRKLKPFKKNIRASINPKLTHKKRKTILQNGGGWFIPLLSAAIPLISSLLTGSK